MPGGDRVLEFRLELAAVVQLPGLADTGAGRAEHGGAADDRRGEQHAEHDTSDDAPPQPVAGAVVGGFLYLSVPSASRLTTRTPSSSALRPSSMDFRAS